MVDAPPYCYFLNLQPLKDPTRGMGAFPKREIDYMKCEVMRFFKLVTKGNVEPISMTVPRKVCCWTCEFTYLQYKSDIQYINKY